ncbi:hypothetical protein FA10DRAFT_276777 [Acaromyces ingoldii]|uniref:LsmAD domain-containing protein n=1 Tax=Acaromyces ingoldii TaxID=215250 RepID=A0A316YXH4_9BASI|nr:hypothetical protein FA10DRAFT_276777 [Acaromyces ingoldii]PWN92763.1 hypothetical protein FA10DRAFT_276777 [Acaromyces ingoldii]
MATQSSWRSQTAGTQRWGNGSASARSNNNNSSSSHGTGSNSSSTAGHDAAAAAAAPSSGRQSGGATHTNAFPPLGAKAAAVDSHEATQRDRLLFLLVGLVGNTVVATTRTGVQYVGILSSTSTAAAASASSTPAQDSLGIILSSAQEILPGQAPGQQPKLGPLKKMLVIQGQDLDSFAAKDVALDVPASMSRTDASAGFRTDTEISKTAEGLSAGRTLQKWTVDDGEALESDGLGLGGGGAGAGVGAGAAGAGAGGLGTGSGGSWDQFAANEARFGVKSNYEETLYTTKLDKSAKDFKEKERRADQLAREIMNSSTNNIHVAEERDLVPQGGDVTEEDRYGAVVRGPNAYVPPAARRAAAAAAAASGTTSLSAAPPKAGNNGAEPGALKTKAKGEESETLPAVVTTAATPTQPTSKKEQQQQQDAVGEFRQFVTQERERLEKKKAALAKKEKDSRLADLKSWGDKFKLKSPVPSDIALVTSRDADARPTPSSTEQGLAAASDKPRDPNLQKSLSPTTAHVQDKTRPSLDSSSPARQAGGTSSVSQSPTAPAAASAVPGAANRNVSASAAPSSASRLAESKAMLSKMTIPKIPPFNPDRIKARQAAAAAAVAAAAGGGGAAAAAAAASSPAAADDAKKGATPAATGKSSFKLSAKASSFKPFNPAAAAFTPGGGGGGAAAAPATGAASPVPVSAAPKAPSSVVSPALGAAPSPASSSAAPAAVAAPAPTATPLPPPHPFFGHRVIKKSSSTPSIHVREDFNPFKAYKVPEAHTIGPMWSFTGKPYRQLFNAVSPPMQGGMGLPGPSSVSDDASASATPHLAHHQPATGGPHMQQQQQQQQQQQPQQQQPQQPQQTPQHQHQPPLQHQQHHHHHPSHQGHHHAPMHSHPPLPHHAPPHGGQPHHMQQHPQAMGMPPGAAGGPHPGPGGQGQNQGGGGPGAGQPFNVMYQPYGPYRFHGQQHMVQGMGMPGPHHHHPQHHQQGGGGGQMPYGGMPPQLMGQMPFSPPMPPHAGPPGGMYSPQMANMVAGPAGAGGGGPRPPPPPSSASSGAGGAAPPPGLQGGANNGGNKMPPQMYYHQQPMPGMPPYGGPMPPPPHMGGPHPPPPHAGGPMPPPGVGGPGGPPPPPSAMLSPAMAASTASTGSNTATSSTSTSNHAPSSAATTPSGKSSSSASTTTGGGQGAGGAP